MATCREKIEHLEYYLKDSSDWKHYSKSRRWLKKQMNKYIRRKNKLIEEDDVGRKQGRKPYKFWEW